MMENVWKSSRGILLEYALTIHYAKKPLLFMKDVQFNEYCAIIKLLHFKK
jgi:hypothetical protein